MSEWSPRSNLKKSWMSLQRSVE